MVERTMIEGFSDVVSQPVGKPPENHRHLKALMLSYARKNPRIEFGGVILTDQKENSQLLGVVVGNEHSVNFADIPYSEDFEQWPDGFDTLVIFHSHPVGSKVDFSYQDRKSFDSVVRSIHEDLNFDYNKVDLKVDKTFYVYDAVLDAKGRIRWSGFSLTASGGNDNVANLFPVAKVIIEIPENWEIWEKAFRVRSAI